MKKHPAAAGGTSVSQAAAMPEARNPRGESPGPPEARSSARHKAQYWSQVERLRRVVSRKGSQSGANSPSDIAIADIASGATPVRAPSHAARSLGSRGSRRGDAVRDREAMEPARQQFVGPRVDGRRPPIPNDVVVSFADLDREAGLAAHSRPSRSSAPRRRDTGT